MKPRKHLSTTTPLLMLLLCALFGGALKGGEQLADEQKMASVKAAYLYSFSKFVTWPATKFSDDSSPIQIGIIGRDLNNMADLLQWAADNKGQIRGRPLVVIRLAFVSSADKEKRDTFVERLRSCHLIFLSGLSKKRQKEILGAIAGHRVLSVGDEGLAKWGGMVALVLRKNNIKFRINLKEVEKEELVISPKVLKKAEIVRD